MKAAVRESLELLLGVEFFDYQLEVFESVDPGGNDRACLYYKTGAGKSITALVLIWLMGHDQAVVITPPSTYAQWFELGKKLGVQIVCMSHAKFRMPSTKMDRTTPVIADEFHLFGGHKGQGWKKLDRLAAGLKAPLILASATPNYNDAERVYCVQHVLDPRSVAGGYIEFLYTHCTTEHNAFGMEPIVTGFRHFANAEEFLASLPGVHYLPDDLVYTISDLPVHEPHLPWLDKFGYDQVGHRIMASAIEERHLRAYQRAVVPDDRLRADLAVNLYKATEIVKGPTLMFCAHSSIAERVYDWACVSLSGQTELVTGKTSEKEKARIIRDFNAGNVRTLVGTASLATGTDGMDKVCDHMIIVDDTDDDALRRQLIGRIMPRGADSDASKKLVRRVSYH